MADFGTIIKELAGGETYAELSERLESIVVAVRDCRKVGELSLKLKIKPNGELGVLISDEVRAKIPERPRSETMFFSTRSGDLVRNDPRQADLPLRQITNPNTQPLRIIDQVAEIAEPVTVGSA